MHKPKPVILDAATTDALIAMAIEEGLLEKDRSMEDDGMFAVAARRNVPKWVREHVLTQITLSPNAKTTGRLGDFFCGELLSEGHLIRVVDKGDTSNIPLALPQEIIHALLLSSGHDIPPREYFARLKHASDVHLEQDEYFKTRGVDSPSVFDEMFAKIPWLGPSKYLDQDFEMRRRYEVAWSAAKPIWEAMNEYSRVAHLAGEYDCLLGVPSTLGTPAQCENVFPVGTEAPEPSDLRLFRIATEAMGVLPRGQTLRESLVLATDPATIALRELLKEWQESLLASNVREIELIQAEIGKARNALRSAKYWG